MFDLAFSELIVIGIVALVVIGPEKLPKIVRSAGKLIGNVQRYANSIMTDINTELQLEDLQRLREELRQSIQSGTASSYQVGQVINHTIEQTEEHAKLQTINPDMPAPLARKLEIKELPTEKRSIAH